MKYELHPACSAWPTMKPEELRELANDITANGLRDPVTLTPDGLLLDGRNRALACETADVEPVTTIFKPTRGGRTAIGPARTVESERSLT